MRLLPSSINASDQPTLSEIVKTQLAEDRAFFVREPFRLVLIRAFCPGEALPYIPGKGAQTEAHRDGTRIILVHGVPVLHIQA